MKLTVATSLALVHSIPSLALDLGRDEHPVVGVIELLKNLKTQVVQEGQTEEVTYAKFATWCTNSKRTLQSAVSTSKEAIESLTDEVASKEAENVTLTEELASLAAEITKYEGADSTAEAARTAENNRYTAADTDFGNTIQAFDTAIQELEAAKPALLQTPTTLVQNLLSMFSTTSLGRLSEEQMDALLAAGGNSSRPDMLASGDYTAHTKKYTFKSRSVVELLKELKSAFEDQRVEATKVETNAANAHALAKDARAQALSAARTAHGEKEGALGDCQVALSAASGSLSDARGDLEADSTSLASTKRECNMKKTEWEERVEIREKEVMALEAGVEILSQVSGVRTEAPTNPTMPPPPVQEQLSLVVNGHPHLVHGGSHAARPSQEREADSGPKSRAVHLLKTEALRLHSKVFLRFAAEVEAKAQSGPFDEVNNAIQKMIFRLMGEQQSDDEHKNWCDLELEKTNSSAQNKQEKLTELGLKVTSVSASAALLTQEIQAASGMVASIDAFLQEATDLRNQGKAENEAAIREAKQAQEAIAKAIAVLQEFYKESGMVAKEAWEFTQQKARGAVAGQAQRGAHKGGDPVTLPSSPALWSSPYTGAADPKNQPNGVLTVLEKIAMDFSQMQAATMAQEATDERNYQEEVKTQQIEKARRGKEAEMKAQEKQRLSDQVASLRRSEAHTKEEKAAADQYLKDLEPACVEGDSTYEDRKAARDDEIQALKEAQVILAEAFEDNSTSVNSTLLQLPGRSFLAPVRSS